VYDSACCSEGCTVNVYIMIRRKGYRRVAYKVHFTSVGVEPKKTRRKAYGKVPRLAICPRHPLQGPMHKSRPIHSSRDSTATSDSDQEAPAHAKSPVRASVVDKVVMVDESVVPVPMVASKLPEAPWSPGLTGTLSSVGRPPSMHFLWRGMIDLSSYRVD
jgi:hypothetical protein